jgi:hypothetical protein
MANVTLRDVVNVTGMSFSLSFVPVPTAMTDESLRRGSNMLGLTPQDGNLLIWVAQYSWTNKEDDVAIASALGRFHTMALTYTNVARKSFPFVYLNVAGAGQSPFMSYGSASLQWLRRASQKFDPSGVFQKVVRGGFKIPFTDEEVFNPGPAFTGIGKYDI